MEEKRVLIAVAFCAFDFSKYFQLNLTFYMYYFKIFSSLLFLLKLISFS